MTELKLKPCDRCKNLVDIRYRVQYQELSDWILVCPDCWQTVKSQPQYRYGGTWKAKTKNTKRTHKK
ncbi:MAG: hypothetical protein AAGE96_08270 [Cyanobacteria bacterium P01_G01_bin.19]